MKSDCLCKKNAGRGSPTVSGHVGNADAPPLMKRHTRAASIGTPSSHTVALCLLRILFPGGGLPFRHDLPGGQKRTFRQSRTHQLVYQHGEQHHAPDHRAVSKALGSNGHTQRHASLRKQRHAQMIPDILTASRKGTASIGTQILAQGANQDVNHADQQH